MKTYWASFLILTFCVPVFSQWQAQTLEPESLYNNKTFVVDNFPQPDGVRVYVKSRNQGEPSMRPIYLYPRIKCNKKAPYKVMDLASFMRKAYPEKMQALIGGATKKYPNGVVHVCSLENVNFDGERLFITVFEPGAEDCDRSKVVDLIFPISLFCEK